MILATEILQDVKDHVNQPVMGRFSIDLFNRYSKLAEITLLDWLTFKEGQGRKQVDPPAPWLTQKDKDWLQPFLVEYMAYVPKDGLPIPKDYYTYEDMRALSVDCGDNLDENKIDMVTSQNFSTRRKSTIPGMSTMICEQVDNRFRFNPAEIGDVKLIYIRFPKYANVVKAIDQTFNTEIPAASGHVNYEWHEGVRSILIHNIASRFLVKQKDQAGLQLNGAAEDLGR